jgi:tRNA(Met) C34 N-acetyltransferase TmcA
VALSPPGTVGVTRRSRVASGELVAERLPKTLRRRLPSHPLPILRIARIARVAVDERFQGHGIGRLLLRGGEDATTSMAG